MTSSNATVIMSPAAKRRIRRALAPLVVAGLYLAFREYADRTRALEAVLGLSHGSPVVAAAVATLTVVLRFAAWGWLGGTLLMWPLEELLLRKATSPPPRGG